jgi:glycerol-3-phosphate dehydrogenase (NAD(P)+)
LLVTAYSQFSRNRTFGGMVGRGYSIEIGAAGVNMVAGAISPSGSIHELNKKLKIEHAHHRAAYNILYEAYFASRSSKVLKEKLR